MIKVVTVVAGGATAVVTPIFLRQNLSENLVSLEVEGRNNCKALIYSEVEKKIIAVCDGTSSVNVEFLFLKGDISSGLTSPQKVTAFQDIQWKEKESYDLRFTTLPPPHNQTSETIKVSKKYEAKLRLLKEAELSKCSIEKQNQDSEKEILCSIKPTDSVYGGDAYSMGIKLITYY